MKQKQKAETPSNKCLPQGRYWEKTPKTPTNKSTEGCSIRKVAGLWLITLLKQDSAKNDCLVIFRNFLKRLQHFRKTVHKYLSIN